MTGDLILFFLLALVAVVTAVAMLITRNTVYSALFLVTNFGTIALFYLLLTGPFIAMAQITVYAGAIMVLFLFVIMLIGLSRLPKATHSRWQTPLAVAMAGLLAIEALYILFFRQTELSDAGTALVDPAFGSPQEIARVMFIDYALPVQVVAIILLVAIVGVLVMTRQSEKPH